MVAALWFLKPSEHQYDMDTNFSNDMGPHG